MGAFTQPAFWDSSPPANTGPLNAQRKANATATLELEGAQAPQSKTITSGSISPTAAYVIVDTEGSAAADDLDVINPVLSGSESLHTGMVLYLKAADSGRVVTVKNSGSANGINTYDGNDYVLSTTHWLKLQLRADLKWYEVEGRAMETALAAGTAAANAATAANAAQADATAAKTISKRNRLYNGCFRVDQERSGSSVTPAASAYVCDNLYLSITQASKLTAQRVSASLAGAPYSEKFTIATAFSAGANDYFAALRYVEGLDCADLLWGTAAAKSITVSFLVKVSVAGTYSFVIKNAAGTYSYVFTKALTAGEQYITQTVPGCTSGVWTIDTSKSLVLSFDLGSGSSKRTATTGAWVSGDYYGANGTVSLVATGAATYEIGQTQIEAGSFATPFENTPYIDALNWSMRFFEKGSGGFGGYVSNGGDVITQVPFKIVKRASPTLSLTNTYASMVNATPSTNGISASGFNIVHAATSSGNGGYADSWTADARM